MRVYKVEDVERDIEYIKYAAQVINSGGLVVFPTETVYGLGADAYNAEAVKKIFLVKGRPLDNPLIVHVSDKSMFIEITEDIPELVYKSIDILWPGPFTVVVRRRSLPPEVSAGLDTVAVRMPAHPVALELIRRSGKPIAAPSANKSGRPSPTRAIDVIRDLGEEVDVILDSGETLYGVESTVIDFTGYPPTLLRPGPLTPEELSKTLGVEIHVPDYVRRSMKVDRPRSPGMKYRHYAPKAEVILVEMDRYDDVERLADKVMELIKWFGKSYKVGVLASEETFKYYRTYNIPIFTLGSRRNLYSIAKNLFKGLRELDYEGVDVIIAEGFEDRGLGLTIMNRLRKAASKIVTV